MNAIGALLRCLGIVCALGILLVGIMGIVDAVNDKATLTWENQNDWTKWDKSKWLAFCANSNGEFANAQTSGLLWYAFHVL